MGQQADQLVWNHRWLIIIHVNTKERWRHEQSRSAIFTHLNGNDLVMPRGNSVTLQARNISVRIQQSLVDRRQRDLVNHSGSVCGVSITESMPLNVIQCHIGNIISTWLLKALALLRHRVSVMVRVKCDGHGQLDIGIKYGCRLLTTILPAEQCHSIRHVGQKVSQVVVCTRKTLESNWQIPSECQIICPVGKLPGPSSSVLDFTSGHMQSRHCANSIGRVSIAGQFLNVVR